MEKIIFFEGRILNNLQEEINRWIEKKNPIITRFNQGERFNGNSSYHAVIITIFYQEPLESPAKK
jgi:Flp pilus assembly CpaF family ATPase